ncbi:MAG: hypothetical protein WD016_13520 [Balneolaceae bacterium]
MIEKNTQPLIVFCLIGMVFIFGSSCGLLGGEKEKNTPDDLMPLAVGNYWEYDFTYLEVIKDTLRYEITAGVEVPVGDTSYTAYAANFLPFPSGAPEYYWLYRNGEAGVYQMGGMAETDTLFMNNIRRMYPAEEGQTWDIPQLSFSRDSLEFYVSDTLSITLIDDGREIVTSAGTFECYVYKFKIDFYEEGVVFTTWDYFMYYSSGVGLVAQISTSEDKPESIKEEMYLMDFSLK